MTKDLIIPAKKQKESINRSEEINSALQDFDLPFLSEDKLENEKNQFFKVLRDCIVDVNVIQQIANSKVLIAEIPTEFRRLYLEGKVKLDDSAKVLGNHTPNLRDGNGNLIGQATIKEGFDPALITNAMANLALYNSVQQIAAGVEQINKAVTTIVKGQQNDRYALITGAYSTYELLDKKDEREKVAPQIMLQIKTGLQQIHLSLNERFQELQNAPKNYWEYFWKGLLGNFNPFSADTVKEWGTKSGLVLNDLILYYKLILLSDIMMNDMGKEPSQIVNNHLDFKNLCDRLLKNNKLMRSLSFSIGEDRGDIKQLSDSDMRYQFLLNQQVDAVKIELSPADVKLLNN